MLACISISDMLSHWRHKFGLFAPHHSRPLMSDAALQAAHEQRPGSAPELNQFTTLFDDDNWAGLLLAQVELQSEDFMLPGEGFGLPGDLALPSGSAPEPVKPQPASVYQIQANCSTEVCLVHSDLS